MLQLFPNGAGHTVILGDLASGGQPQVIVSRGVWQGSVLRQGGEFALLGCTVAPGFDYADYENGQGETLLAQYPQCADLMRRLTPG